MLRLCSGGRWRLESFTGSQGHGIIRLFHRIRLTRNLNRMRKALGITWGGVIRILILGFSEIRPTREMGPGDMFEQPISESYNWVRISMNCDCLVPGHQGNWGPPLGLGWGVSALECMALGWPGGKERMFQWEFTGDVTLDSNPSFTVYQ